MTDRLLLVAVGTAVVRLMEASLGQAMGDPTYDVPSYYQALDQLKLTLTEAAKELPDDPPAEASVSSPVEPHAG